jgi:sphingomyelin phosphodiesterase 2
MTDSWLQLHGEPDANKFDMENMVPNSYTQFFGYTCNSPFNTFSRYYAPNDPTSNARKLLGKRLDYIFYRHTPQLSCMESKVVLTEMIPGTSMSYSDHFGVVSVFKVSPRRTQWADEMAPQPAQIGHPSFTRLQPSTIEDVLNALKLDQQKANRDANWLLSGFLICVMMQVILYTLIIVLPTELPQNLVIILVTVFGGFVMNSVSILIPVCLIVGFVFGSTEQRALLQFINEIETFQKDGKMISDDCSISIPNNNTQQQLQ